jgi:hypothetical protein
VVNLAAVLLLIKVGLRIINLRRAAPRRDRAAGPRSREVRRSQPSTATPGRLSSLRERWRSQR